jgi:hypothetical protein
VADFPRRVKETPWSLQTSHVVAMAFGGGGSAGADFMDGGATAIWASITRQGTEVQILSCLPTILACEVMLLHGYADIDRPPVAIPVG